MVWDMTRILVLTDYYLPGYRAGGLIRAVSNLIEQLGDEFTFYVLTRDRDMGSSEPYPGILAGEWQNVGKAQVRYLAPHELTLSTWRQVMHSINYDLIYLNGFFTYQCIYSLLLRKLRQIHYRPVVIAPRGSLLLGNLSVKAVKKMPFLALTRMIGLYSDVTWQALTEIEASSIRAYFANDIQRKISALLVAQDLFFIPPAFSPPQKLSGSARLVFISRIAPEKSLHLALQYLVKITKPVQFDIYGVIDDPPYWRECQKLMKHLPSNIQVEYKGTLHPSQVHETFAHYHTFLLPSQGDNLNYAILESLSSGCIVLCSDRNAWQNIQSEGAGWAIPLDQPAEFERRLREVISMDQLEFNRMSYAARAYAENFVQHNDQIEASRQLFNTSLQMRKNS